MYCYDHEHRVRYRECDPMGFVYHAHYVDFFEAARTEAFRRMGLPYRAIEESGIIMPVIDLSIRYRQPARYDDVLIIRCLFRDIPETRFRIGYEVHRRGDGTILTEAHTTLCFVNTARKRPVGAPAPLVMALSRAQLSNGHAVIEEAVLP